nr:GAF domain-containing protein [Nocardia panacis]
MPRRRVVRSNAERERGGCAPRWALIETLGGPMPSVMVDGKFRRQFANLARSTIASGVIAARRVPELVRRCVHSGMEEIDYIPTYSGAESRMVARPVLGPSGVVYVVSLWAGHESFPVDAEARVGAFQLDLETGIADLSDSFERLLGCTEREGCGRSLSDLLAHLDGGSDRSGLLDLLDPQTDREFWVGTATTAAGRSVGRRHLYLAAKAVGFTSARVVRGLVYDITPDEPAPPADPEILALAHLPVVSGHTIGLVDLRTSHMYRVLVIDPALRVGRGRLNPRIHPDDTCTVDECRAELLKAENPIVVVARVRFSDDEPWRAMRAVCTRIPFGDRPQVLVDLTLES